MFNNCSFYTNGDGQGGGIRRAFRGDRGNRRAFRGNRGGGGRDGPGREGRRQQVLIYTFVLHF